MIGITEQAMERMVDMMRESVELQIQASENLNEAAINLNQVSSRPVEVVVTVDENDVGL